jgi:Fe-S-cluster-containing hydrogenase component 2
MKRKAIVVGGGMSGMSCALKLQKAGIDYLLITDVLGGRVCYSKEDGLNYGAYFVMESYNNAKRVVTPAERLDSRDSCFHNSPSEFFSAVSLHTLGHIPGFIRFNRIMKKFIEHYEPYKAKCMTTPQKVALAGDPYLNDLFSKPAADFIRENRIELLASDYISKFSYACTGVGMDRITALDFCNVSMGMLVPLYKFKFDADDMARRLGEHLVFDSINKIETEQGLHTLTGKSGRDWQCENIVFATPASVTKELLHLGEIRESCKLYVYRVRGRLKARYAKRGTNLFPFESNIVSTARQTDGTCLVFTREPEQAEWFVAMGDGYQTPAQIAEKLGKDLETAAEALEKMAKDGLIFRLRKGGEIKYKTIPVVHGTFEFNIHRLAPDWIVSLASHLGSGLAARFVGTPHPFYRTVPVNASIDSTSEVLPYDNAEEIIDRNEKIAVAPCICRTANKTVNNWCGCDLETCLIFGEFADYYVENKLGRYISKEEARDILHDGIAKGRISQVANSQNPEVMCSCCTCGCGMLQIVIAMGKDSVGRPFITNYYSETIPDKCSGACSELCISCCPPKSRHPEDGKVLTDSGACLGCGLCVTHCPNKAIRMVKKAESSFYQPPETIFYTYDLMAEYLRKNDK